MTLFLPFEANRVLDWTLMDLTRGVIVIHGAHRDADNALGYVMEAARAAGDAQRTTLVVAPQFLSEEDVLYHGLPENILYWHCGGWKKGNLSLDRPTLPRPARVSSFAVMDALVRRIAEILPNLRTLVLAGHSSGAQFVQRYAAGNTVEDEVRQQHGVEMEYVVGNPGSYLYIGPERALSGSPGVFAVPDSATRQSCPSYDAYKYGLEDRNSYMGASTAADLRGRYRARTVTYLLGERDDDPADPLLDTGCEAMLQGSHRLERGLVFRDHLTWAWAGDTAGHRTSVLPGVWHDPLQVYTSPCGLASLFGFAAACP